MNSAAWMIPFFVFSSNEGDAEAIETFLSIVIIGGLILLAIGMVLCFVELLIEIFSKRK